MGLVWQDDSAESAGLFEAGFGPQGEQAESAGPYYARRVQMRSMPGCKIQFGRVDMRTLAAHAESFEARRVQIRNQQWGAKNRKNPILQNRKNPGRAGRLRDNSNANPQKCEFSMK